jgi:hypothetical protein
MILIAFQLKDKQRGLWTRQSIQKNKYHSRNSGIWQHSGFKYRFLLLRFEVTLQMLALICHSSSDTWQQLASRLQILTGSHPLGHLVTPCREAFAEALLTEMDVIWITDSCVVAWDAVIISPNLRPGRGQHENQVFDSTRGA